MRISDWSSDVCSSDLRVFAEQAAAAGGDTAGAAPGAGDVGAARPRYGGRMVVRHQHEADAAAEQTAPAPRRDGAARGGALVDRLEGNEPLDRVETGEQPQFAIGGKAGTQQAARDPILSARRCEAGDGLRNRVDCGTLCHRPHYATRKARGEGK